MDRGPLALGLFMRNNRKTSMLRSSQHSRRAVSRKMCFLSRKFPKKLDGVAKSWVNEVHDVSLVVWEHLLVQLPAIERVNE
jgi:hypothetical protein